MPERGPMRIAHLTPAESRGMAGVFSTGSTDSQINPTRLPNHNRAGNLVTRPLPCILSAATVTINQIPFLPPSTNPRQVPAILAPW